MGKKWLKVSTFLLLIFATSIANANSLMVSNTKIETNFINLSATKIQLYEKGKQVVVTSPNYLSPKLYVANRFSSSIQVYDIKSAENFDAMTITEEIQIPPFKGTRLPDNLILDIFATNDHLFVSRAAYFSVNTECSYAEILQYDLRPKEWSTIFVTTPCVGGVEAWTDFSGRLAFDGSSLYSIWGNVYIDLYRNVFPRVGLCCVDENYKQAVKASNFVGAVVKTDLKSRDSKKIATGFRNPQGLFYDYASKTLWSSDHGPRGGDELNRVSVNKDYGYPFVTLGRPYLNDNLLQKNSLNVKYGTHTGYEYPVYSWTPSIGPSQVSIVHKSSVFSDWWSGDLLLSTLKDMSIQRLKMKCTTKVLYSERIYIGERIRDMTLGQNFIIVSTDDGALILLSRESKISEGTFPARN